MHSLRWSLALNAVLAVLAMPSSAHAFCGFYVAKADTKLFNKASKVVMVRDGNRTVMTMANDFRGDPKEFAVVIPVPTFLERGQIHVGDRAVIDHLDAYSAPRLVEYFDENPCRPRVFEDALRSAGAPMAVGNAAARAKSLGVTIEAAYTVGEYDILILSAKESSGLETWLTENGYRIPAGAADILRSYLRQNLRFFVAKVNLAERAKLGFSFLRPLQIAYESPKFMLPIRLGMVNADGLQELFVFALSREGRVETTNYRTVRLPSDMDIPVYVKDDFGRFYKDLFTRQTEAAEPLGGVPRVRLGHGLVRSLRGRSAVAARSCASWACSGSTAQRTAAAGSTSSSLACTCATTDRISRKTSFSSRPRTARASRGATCCATPGRAARTARRRASTTRLCASATSARRRPWPS